MNHQKLFALTVAAMTATTLACSQAADPPTSPSGSNPFRAEAGPDGSTLKVTAPNAISPAGGEEISDLDPDLEVSNAQGRFVPGLTLSYVFEVLNSANQVVYRSSPVPSDSDGTTEHEIQTQLADDETHTWRAYAVFQGQRGPMSGAASFKTVNRFGESCAHLGEPVAIIACRFEQHGGGGMDHEELIQFMKEVAFDLNRAIPSDKGGYGLLIKDVGNNCLGYSCDIICEGNGSNQNQFDILRDESDPQWSEVGEGIVVRQCEIIR